MKEFHITNASKIGKIMAKNIRKPNICTWSIYGTLVESRGKQDKMICSNQISLARKNEQW